MTEYFIPTFQIIQWDLSHWICGTHHKQTTNVAFNIDLPKRPRIKQIYPARGPGDVYDSVQRLEDRIGNGWL